MSARTHPARAAADLIAATSTTALPDWTTYGVASEPERLRALTAETRRRES
jgi:hypothetical protein